MIDAHNHLYSFKEFEEIPVIMARAREAGVGRMLCNAACENDWEEIAALVEAYPGEVVGAFGIHPWYVKEVLGGWEETAGKPAGAIPGSYYRGERAGFLS
jgi:Tat protein secretion system quality control protein TatD with DNase activity